MESYFESVQLFLFVCNFVYISTNSVNSKIFARTLFSRIALKDIFVTLKSRATRA